MTGLCICLLYSLSVQCTREHRLQRVQVQVVLLAMHKCPCNLTLKRGTRLLNLHAAELETPMSPLSWLRPPRALQRLLSHHQLTRMARDGEGVGYVEPL